jgi:hypothetical protein
MQGRIQVAWRLALSRGEQWSAPALDPEEKGGGGADRCMQEMYRPVTRDTAQAAGSPTIGARAEESRASAPEQVEHAGGLCVTVCDRAGRRTPLARVFEVASVYSE